MDAVTLYIVSMFFFVLVAGLFCFSVHIFKRAVDLGPIRETLRQLQAQEKDLKEKIATGHNTLNAIKKSEEDMRIDLANAKETIATACSLEEKVEKNKNRVADQKREIDRNNAEIQKLTDKKNPLQDEINTKAAELQQIAGEAARLKEKISDLHNAKRELEHITASLPGMRKDYENLNRDLAQKNVELSGLLAQIDRLESKRKRGERELDGLIQQIKASNKKAEEAKGEATYFSAQVGAARADAGRRWEDLDRPVVSLPDQTADSGVSESVWLAEFQENLRKCGIVFPDRVVRAFHTGLKIADYSPLIVLAGISGTGKSLLPQLYARACGMNFLPLAVQPRWDSPQDMLGFYNYMERRYKATDLARLLWQFDRYNNPAARGIAAEDLPMNLVLLDEMNIARVEYYFSDMLSKLEVRRTVNPEDGESRKAAEIAIESGPDAGAKESGPDAADAGPRRLFIGKNTLFVGTMNEDESTQTLSEKVIDRSNVLRFGRPQNLNVNPRTEAFLARYPGAGTEYRPYGIWKQWQRSDGEAGEFTEALCPILDGLNGALTLVQRPFAYRVCQAVIRYVANYPGAQANANDDNFRDALEDQIEMKILPKLNGIEKNEGQAETALDGIAAVINQHCRQPQGGGGLLDAFNEARNDPGVFFKWQGVSR